MAGKTESSYSSGHGASLLAATTSSLAKSSMVRRQQRSTLLDLEFCGVLS